MPPRMPSEAADTPVSKRAAATFIAACFLVTLLYEKWQGRVWWCKCRSPNPVSLDVNSMHNSQHLLDPYSVSHVLHGLIFFGLLWFARRWVSFSWRLALATLVEAVWEMCENSPFIINRYRAQTVSLGYEGDSVANSLSDIACLMAGFCLARRLGLWRSVALFLAAELLMLWWMRDNLSLNVLMLLWPIRAIKDWQSHG